MAKIDKQQIAVFAFIGLFLVGTIMWGISSMSPDEKKEEVQEGVISSGSGFEAPKDINAEKEEYKSSLDIYEQNQKEEIKADENVRLNFDLTSEKKSTTEKVTVEEKKVVEKTTNYSGSNKTVATKTTKKQVYTNTAKSTSLKSEPSNVKSEQVETVYEEPVRTKKRGLVSAMGAEEKGNSENVVSSANEDKTTPFTAIFHGDQTILNNRPVKLRATKAFLLNGKNVQKGTLLTGISQFSGDYLNITINSIEIDGQPVACNFTAFKNGQKGIFSPSGVDKEIANENASRNSNKGVTVGVPIIGGSISLGGMNKKIQAKERQTFVPSQTSINFVSSK